MTDQAKVIPLPQKPVFRRSYVQGLLSCTEFRADQGENAAFGQVVHDAIHRYTLSCLTHREETRLEDIETIARDAFYQLPRGLQPSRLDEARDLLDRFAHSHTANLDTLFRVEHTMTADVDFAVLTGTVDRLDRIDGGDPDDPPTEIRVVDYKTQWAPEDFTFQMRFYGALACLTWPSVQRVETDVDYVRPGIHQTVEYDRETLLTWWDDVLYGLKARLDGPKGTPTGGAGCQYCAKRLRCGAAASIWKSVPENESQAQEVFQDLVRLEAASDETRKSLEAYFNGRSPVTWQGYELGFLQPREPLWRPGAPQMVVDYLNSKGLDGPLVVVRTVDSKKIPPYLQQEMADAGVATYELGKPAFRHRKAQADKVHIARRPTVVPSVSPPHQPGSTESLPPPGPAGVISLSAAGTGSPPSVPAVSSPVVDVGSVGVPSPPADLPLSPGSKKVVERLHKAVARSRLQGHATDTTYAMLRRQLLSPVIGVIFPEAVAGEVVVLSASQAAALLDWASSRLFKLERDQILADVSAQGVLL